MSWYTSKPLLLDVKNSFHHTDTDVQESDNDKNDFQKQDTIVTVTHEQLAKIDKDFVSLKKLFLLLVALTIVLLFVCSFLVIYLESKCARNKYGSLPNFLTSVDDINKIVQENLASNDFLSRAHKHIFCVSCDALRETEPHFFESIGNNKCCIENLSIFIRLLKYTFLKSLNEYNSKVRSLKSRIDDLKEDINILETALFISNKTNVTDSTNNDVSKESFMWDTIQKNNRLINTLLNRKSSLLHLTGTADHTGIRWTEDIQSGDLSYDEQGIHVNSGGKYFIYCNIHFAKKVCNGTENFEYSISQEYYSMEFLPIARVRKGCATGRSINTGLFVQSVLQVELGQHKTLRIQYDRNNQEYIATENKLHDIIVFEI
ncbi:uncharacterized protein LOC123553810 [Mercenaria mercenaria]|uniref:uncharacterized protein LOC123553810 n=1 Tax=Mercenaria mercenaria TaxID=6596 RepID=UPI00234EDBF9|nr:uncharacterized protein LOC123553810 [Mercenaria mercenaria]XP_053404715.1 uncharacterized protein LOC123553810 [Mercenaria mercenaria]